MSSRHDSQQPRPDGEWSRQQAIERSIHSDASKTIRNDGGSASVSPVVNLGKFGRDIVDLQPGETATYVVFRDHVEIWPNE
jgi:hypothetical protein